MLDARRLPALAGPGGGRPAVCAVVRPPPAAKIRRPGATRSLWSAEPGPQAAADRAEGMADGAPIPPVNASGAPKASCPPPCPHDVRLPWRATPEGAGEGAEDAAALEHLPPAVKAALLLLVKGAER